MLKIFRTIYRNYSTYMKKNENNEIKILVKKMKNYKFYCDCNIYPCHCLQYGEPCKLYNNKEAHINFAKHLLHINSKKIKEKKSNNIYKNHLDEWYF